MEKHARLSLIAIVLFLMLFGIASPSNAQSGSILRASVNIAARGQTIGLLASGFTPGEGVTWWYKRPTAKYYEPMLQTQVASQVDTNGFVGNGFGVTYDGEPGVYVFQVKGTKGEVATTSVTITQESLQGDAQVVLHPMPLQPLPPVEKLQLIGSDMPKKFFPGEINFKVRVGKDLGTILANHGARLQDVQHLFGRFRPGLQFNEVEKQNGIDLWFKLAIPPGNEIKMLQELKQDPDIEFVELEATEGRAAFVPTDPFWPYQWGPQKINVMDAWDIRQGYGGRVAVIDTGVDGTHEDLSGLVDLGIDYVNNRYINPNTNSDDNGHGTHVAGIVAAAANNGVGIAGVSFGAHIMPFKVLRWDGTPVRESDLYNAVLEASNPANGIKVINMSLEFYRRTESGQAAIDSAYQQGVTLHRFT